MYPQITLTHAKDNLDKLCEQVIDDREVVIITQPTCENVALIAADELSSLMETVHLLKSPQNAIRLLTELQDAKERTKIKL
jgi:antitoxin YefM